MPHETHIFSHPSYAPAKDIATLLCQYTHIVITAHKEPDGDALGSMLALAHGLKKLGKNVALMNATGIPTHLQWMLPHPDCVHKKLHSIGFTPELVVVLDCGDAHRVGEDFSEKLLHFPSINIDHHIGNPNFGSVGNWADPNMAAAGQMVAAILNALNVTLTGAIAEAIYVAISSDTGNFSFDNTTAEILLLAAHLVYQGVKVAQIHQNISNTWSLARMRLWGDLMQEFVLERQGTIAYIVVSLNKRNTYNMNKEDLEGFVNNLRRLRGTQVTFMLREDSPKCCKLSLRSTGAVDVRAMVSPLGGGGHRNAAGATLQCAPEEALHLALEAVRTWLDEHPDAVSS